MDINKFKSSINNRIEKIFNHINKYVIELSTKGIYILMLLYYAYHNADTPSWARRIIIGSIAYFISPIDSIPDLTPLIGMTDDMGVITFGLVTVACYINEEVREKALSKLNNLIGKPPEHSIIEEVNSWL